jgi:hypothetical protein
VAQSVGPEFKPQYHKKKKAIVGKLKGLFLLSVSNGLFLFRGISDPQLFF